MNEMTRISPAREEGQRVSCLYAVLASSPLRQQLRFHFFMDFFGLLGGPK